MDLKILYIFLFMATTTAKDTCTNHDFLKVMDGKALPNRMIFNITTAGVMSCSRACLMRKICKSFNYNDQTGNCQLNTETMTPPSDLVDLDKYVFADISNSPSRLAGSCAEHQCPPNSYCEPGQDLYSCLIFGCLSLPHLKYGRYNTTTEHSPIGTYVSLTCDERYYAEEDVHCQENGTWSETRCEPVSSCGILKRLHPDSEDGEYWLILPNLDNYRARIYCHNMASLEPSEYLTLTNENQGSFPKVANFNCNGDGPLISACAGLGGEVWFYKIKLNIETLQVNVLDLTFATVSGRKDALGYGIAHDCYTMHTNGRVGCGVKGEFNIDMSHTGWRISDEQQWEIYGYASYMMPVERQRSGTLIYLNCGGFPGGCRPRGGLFLAPYPEDINSTP